MSKLTVVYLKTTGHVLAALTRADPPEGDEPVTALVGSSLTASAIGTVAADVAFPASVLAAVTVDDDQPDVLINPQNFQVVEDPQGQAPPQVKNFGVPGIVVLSLSTAAGAKVTVTNVPSSTSLPAVVVLQKVTSPSLAPTILSPVTVSVGPGGTVVADTTGFAPNDTWNMYAFVQGQPPVASANRTL
jgi:hypothetical protein